MIAATTLAYQSKTVTVGVAVVQLIGPSPRRKRLEFRVSTSGRVTVHNLAGVTLDSAVTLLSVTYPLILSFEDHGDAVRQDWFAIADAASQVVSIVEIIDAG